MTASHHHSLDLRRAFLPRRWSSSLLHSALARSSWLPSTALRASTLALAASQQQAPIHRSSSSRVTPGSHRLRPVTTASSQQDPATATATATATGGRTKTSDAHARHITPPSSNSNATPSGATAATRKRPHSADFMVGALRRCIHACISLPQCLVWT